MDPRTAHEVARALHGEQVAASGGRVIEHVERVAAAVPPQARVVAFLHDVLERTETTVESPVLQGLSPDELAALRLLTRMPGEPYELYVLRIAYAPGPAGALARTVKAADLDDHLRPDTRPPRRHPPYRWARRHIAIARDRLDTALPAT